VGEKIKDKKRTLKAEALSDNDTTEDCRLISVYTISHGATEDFAGSEEAEVKRSSSYLVDLASLKANVSTTEQNDIIQSIISWGIPRAAGTVGKELDLGARDGIMVRRYGHGDDERSAGSRVSGIPTTQHPPMLNFVYLLIPVTPLQRVSRRSYTMREAPDHIEIP
jgi:hypothetical protein